VTTTELQDLRKTFRAWVRSRLPDEGEDGVTRYAVLQQMIADLATLMFDAGRDCEREEDC